MIIFISFLFILFFISFYLLSHFVLSFRRQKDTSDKESISRSSEQSKDCKDDCSGTDISVDDVRQKQEKMSEELWDGVHRKTLQQLPEDIDGKNSTR